MIKPNYIIVLNALMAAPGERIIKLPSGVLVGWLNNKLHLIMHSSHKTLIKEEMDEVWYEFDIRFNTFVIECSNITEEDIISIVASTALQKVKKG